MGVFNMNFFMKEPEYPDKRWSESDAEYEQKLKSYEEDLKTYKEGRRKSFGLIGLGIIVLILIIVMFASMTKIDAGHTGVVTTFGKVSQNVLDEGLHFKSPLSRVTKFDNRVQKAEITTSVSTKDTQAINTVLSVNYSLAPEKSYYIYQNVGKHYFDTLVAPAVDRVYKEVASKYSADENVTKRDEIAAQVIEGINENLADYGISVSGVLVDANFNESYQAAINEKQVAVQNKLKAEAEAEKAIIEAQAEAEKKKISAEANAKAILIEAEAEAKANEKLNKSLSDKVINYEAIQKWNGELPKVSGSTGTFVNFSDIAGTKSKN